MMARSRPATVFTEFPINFLLDVWNAWPHCCWCCHGSRILSGGDIGPGGGEHCLQVFCCSSFYVDSLSLCDIVSLSFFPTCMLCSVAHINHISMLKNEK
jgi:hypothetical protein